MSDIIIINTGVANIASVEASLRRLGRTPTLSDDPDRVARAPQVILPGVGTFGAAMEQLRARGLVEAIHERIRSERPLMGICLGLQLLCDTSEESTEVSGLGVVDEPITRFQDHRLRIPHFGWNRVTPTEGAQLLTEGWAYYANSYKLDHIPAGFEGALTEHGHPFVAALERGSLLACQFHPELSGPWGASLIQRWLEATC